MSVVRQMSNISGNLRDIVRERWTDDDIFKHVMVRLPAPIFDRLVMDIRQDLMLGDLVESRSYFEFAGIRYERVPGIYATVGMMPVSEALRTDPDAAP